MELPNYYHWIIGTTAISQQRSAISDTIIIGIGVATLVRVTNIIMSYQYYKELQIIISAYQNLPKLAKELYQVITVRETTIYHGNVSEGNIPAAVLKKLLDVYSSIYPHVILVALHT